MEGTGKLFFRQEPQLASRYTVVCLPSRHEPPFDYAGLINDVAAVLDAEGAQQATIVAESFGGTVALQFALQHQDRIHQLVLINTFPYFRRRIRLLLGQLLLPLTFIRLGNGVREWFYKLVLRMEDVDQAAASKLLECSFSHGLPTSKQRMSLIRSLDVRDRLPEIKVPVTLIASGRDKLTPSIKEARFMASQMPNARVVILPKHGHTPLVTESFSLASVLSGF